MRTMITVVVLVLLASCSKEERKIEFTDCIADPVIYDSAAVVGKLIGTWVIVKQKCGWVGDTDAPAQNVRIRLNSDFSFVETRNGQIVLQGTWFIDRHYGSATVWELHFRRQNGVADYNRGAVRFCGNNLIVDSYPTDGCLTYYYSIN